MPTILFACLLDLLRKLFKYFSKGSSLSGSVDLPRPKSVYIYLDHPITRVRIDGGLYYWPIIIIIIKHDCEKPIKTDRIKGPHSD